MPRPSTERRPVATALALLTGLSCGARSELLVSDVEIDAGSGGTSGVGGVGGSSGVGGVVGVGGGAGVGGSGGSSGVGGNGGSSGCPAALQPELIAAVDAPTGPSFLELDDSHVYWTVPAAGTVLRVHKCGGTIETISAGEPTPLGIGLFGSYVFWVASGMDFSDGIVRRAPKSVGGVSTLASGLPAPWAIAVDGDGVFWSNNQGAQGGTFVVPHNGGAPKKLADGGGYAAIALDDTHVFWASGDIGRAPKAGGSEEILVGGRPHAWCVAVDDDWVYWTNYTGNVERIAKSGGVPVEIEQVRYWRCLTLDATHVYAAADGLSPGVFRFPKSGGGPVDVLSEAGGADVAVDADHAYWTSGASIWRVAK